MKKGMRKGLTSYGDADFSLFLRKAFIKAMGLSDDALSRPVVGIANTFSDYNACHGNVPKLVEAIKRGVMLAGALPMEFPTISIHESFAHPTSMFLRNLMAMDTEEMIRAQPMDAVVLIGGCDKTIPAQMMACASADVPTIIVPVGPMLVGHYQGEQLGACTDCRRLWGEFRGGRIDADEIERVSERLAPTPGTCMVMGTASTMACIAEAIGLALPRSASIPATHADRLALGRGERPVRRRDGGERRPETIAGHERRGVPQRDDRSASDRRLDQRARAPDGSRGPARSQDRSRGIRPARTRSAGAARPQAFGQALHGALPLGRRRAAAAARARWPRRLERAHGDGRHAARLHGDRPKTCRART